MNTKHNQEPDQNDVEQLIKQMANTVHEKATTTAKSRFAEMMKDVQEKELDPDELELYYEAFSELTRTPDEAKEFVMKQLQHLVAKDLENESDNVITIEQPSPNADISITNKDVSVDISIDHDTKDKSEHED